MDRLDKLIMDGVNRSESSSTIAYLEGEPEPWQWSCIHQGASLICRGKTMEEVSGRMLEAMGEIGDGS